MTRLSASRRDALALAYGTGALLGGSFLWLVAAVLTKHHLGFLSVGVGAAVGLAMYAAKPTNALLAVVAAANTLVGCILGSFATFVYLRLHDEAGLAAQLGVRFTYSSYRHVLVRELMHPGNLIGSFAVTTYLFWAIGAFVAASITFTRIASQKAPSGSSDQH